MKPHRAFPAKKLEGNALIDCMENVAIESAMEVRLGKEFLAAFVCSPGLEEELTLGYLLSTGIVNSLSSVLNVKCTNRKCAVELKPGESARTDRGFSQVRRFMSTECSAPEVLIELRTGGSIPTVQHELTVGLEQLVASQARMNEGQELYRETHGAHAAFIGQVDGEEYSVAEDIGRHNAIDKAIGLAVKKGMDLRSAFLLCTGRLTADVVSKCAWTSIPLVASYSAATDAGVIFAKKANITMMGMFRGNRAKIYNLGAAQIRF